MKDSTTALGGEKEPVRSSFRQTAKRNSYSSDPSQPQESYLREDVAVAAQREAIIRGERRLHVLHLRVQLRDRLRRREKRVVLRGKTDADRQQPCQKDLLPETTLMIDV